MINAELIKTIFEKGAAFSGPIKGISPEIDENLQSVSFLHFTKQQIDKITAELSKKYVYEMLKDYNFTFIYNPQLLDNVCALKNLNQNQIEYISYLILYNYIAFISQFECKRELPDIKPLFRSFIQISFQSQLFLTISSKCFNYAFQLLLKFDKTTDIYAYVEYYFSYAALFCCPKLTLQLFDRLFELEPKFYDFLYSLSVILHEHPNFFDEAHEDNYTIDSQISYHSFLLHIIEQLTPAITQFEPSTIKLFQSLHNLTDDIAMTLFPLFCQSIQLKIFHDKPIKIETKENGYEPLDLKIPSSIQLFLNFPSKPTFVCQFDPSQKVTFPHSNELKKFLDSELIEKLKQIEIMTKYESRLIEIFLSSLFALLHFQEKSNFFYNIYAAILYFANEIADNVPGTFSISTELALSFFHPRIFDSSVTVFNENSDFAIINSFRSISLEWLCLDNGDAINQLLNVYFISSPLLLAELLYRFVGMTSVIIEKIGTFPKLIESLRKIAVVYQEFDRNCDEKDEKKHDAILKVRVSLFTLIAHLFSNESVLKTFFLYSPDHFYLSCETSFTSAYLSFLFEERICPYIITSIRNFFVNNKEIESKDIDAIASVFNVIIANATAMFPRQEAMLMIKDFFGMLNEIMLYNQMSFANHFKELCPILCTSLPNLTNCELAKQVFEVSISCFTLMSTSFEIKTLEIDAILSCLALFDDKEFVVSLYTKFIQLLAGERLLSIKPSFIVKQPQIIKIFIQILFVTPKIQEVLVFFHDLLKFSPINLQRCANCDLDIYILEFLEKEKVKERLDTEVIQKVLSIYSLLSSRHSTTQAVLRFISLLAPIDETHVSKYESLFFTAFENIISTVYRIPEYMFPINRKKLLTIDLVSSNDQQVNSSADNHINFSWNLNSNSKDTNNDCVKIPSLIETKDLVNGFSLAFWIRVEPTETKHKIFSIFLGKNILLSLYLSKDSIFFSQDDSVTESVYKVSESFPLHTWQFVVVSYMIQPQRSRVFFDVNCVEEATSTLPILKKPPDFNNVKIIINDNNFDDENLFQQKDEAEQPSTQIGLVVLLPLLMPENQSIIREFGVRPTAPPPIPYYFFIVREKNYVKNDDNDLIDILITKCGIDTILPIFKLRDYKYKDGGSFDFQIEYALNFLNKILLFNDAAQKRFYDCQGFNILCQLIIDYWLDKFNMKLYTNLISILQSLTNEDLQIQLFCGLLMHFPFLMKLNSHLHEKILRYAAQSLFPSFKSVALKCRGLGVILSALRKFYYYSPAELTIIYQPKLRPNDLNIQLCRSVLFEILFSFASDKFTKDDFECVVSHCASCTELAQILDMFTFLVKVFTDLSDSIDFSVENDTFSFLILFFIRYPNESFQFLIVDLIDNCYKNKLISSDCFISHVTEIIKMIPSNAITKEMVNYVKDKFVDNPLFLPLVCFLVIHFKDVELQPFLNSLKPSPVFITDPFWAIWPLCLSLFCSAEDSMKIILFLIQCDPSMILDIYAQFDSVFEFYPKQRRIIENSFLSVLSHVYIVAEKPPSINDYLELSERIIFFDHANEKSTLNLLYSMFYKKRKKETKDDFHFSPQNIFDVATNSTCFNEILTFNVSYSSFQCWSHVNLALSCTNKFAEQGEKYDASYGFFDLVLCAFLQEYGLNTVCDELTNSSKIWTDIPNVEIAVQLLYYHAVMAERDENERLNSLSNSSNTKSVNEVKLMLLNSPLFSPFSYIVNNVSSPLLNQQKFELFKNELIPRRYTVILNEKLESLHSFHSRMKNLDSIIPNSDINKHVAVAMDHLLLFDELEQRNEENMKKRWKRLWAALTVERAPWCMSCPVKNAWKRDNSFCTASMTPLMMIRMQQIDLIENSTFREKDSKFSLELECVHVSPQERKNGVLSFTEKTAYLIVEEVRNTLFYFENIKFIFWQKNCGLLFITSQGINHLIEFNNEDDKRSVIHFFESRKNIILEVLQNAPSKDFFYTASFQRKWQKWKITNFQYLMFLNFLSGRNFDDIDNYPIMPWVLNDYGTEKLEIDEESIRDFSQINKKARTLPMNRKHVLSFLRQIEPFKTIYINESTNTNEHEIRNESTSTNTNKRKRKNKNESENKNTNESESENKCTFENENNNDDDDENNDDDDDVCVGGLSGIDGLMDLMDLSHFGFELIPELFSMPEVLEDESVVLPKWAKTPLDFVYFHRKVLESDQFSRRLHEFISSLWSFSRHSFFPLFDGIHPMRNLRVKNSLLDDVYDFSMTGISRLSCSSFSDKTGNKTMTLFAFSSTGVVYSYKFSSSKRRKTCTVDASTLSSHSSKSKLTRLTTAASSLTTTNAANILNCEKGKKNLNVEKGKNILNVEKDKNILNSSVSFQSEIRSAPSAPSMVPTTISVDGEDRLLSSQSLLSSNELVHTKTELILIKTNKYDFPFIHFDRVHSLPNGKFLIQQKKFNRVAIVGQKHLFLETQMSQITCIASDGGWIVIGGDSSVNLFKNSKFFCAIQIYRDLILTVGISSTFNAVVAGTKDGSLIICSILYGSMVKVIEMKKMVPVKIVISPSWGFIISYYQSIVLGSIKHYLFVHTINGEFVRKIDINFAVEDWICWSNCGVDFILILANDGEIFYAEVYFLELVKIFKSAKMQAVSLAYSTTTNCAIVTQSSGHAYFIPLVIK